MAETDILNKKEIFKKLLALGRIHDAVKLLRGLSEQKMAWEITDELNRTESSYRYLLKYATDGVDDPARDDVYGSIVDDLLVIFDRFARFVSLTRGTSAYLDAFRRVAKMSVGETINNCLRAISDVADPMSQSGVKPADAEAKALVMFERIWTAFPLKSDDAVAIKDMLNSDVAPRWLKQQTISALMLGNNEYFDSRRVELLCSVYADGNDRGLSLIALTCLLLTLSVNRARLLSPRLMARLASLGDKDTWGADLKMVWLELVRTRDTERITRKIKDEVVPGMMKLKPEVDKKFNHSKIEELDINELEENPQWQELLENSGLGDKLRELTELQQEGADVMMGTFAHLKNFPFFNSVGNWFLPFYTDHSTVVALGENGESIGHLVSKTPYICDNDKYSFVLALSGVGKDQRNMMLSQLKSQNIQAEELAEAASDQSGENGKDAVNRFVRSIYRFYKLYRRREDLRDPLASPPDLTAVPALSHEASDVDTIRLVAEFYFRHGYYEDALPYFQLLESAEGLDSQLFQKLGYCYQKLGQISEALAYYEKAELLDASGSWTLKRIAQCKREAGDLAGALEYYRRVDQLEPEKLPTLRQIANLLIAMEKYDEALKLCYKISWLDNDRPRSLRPLAWTQLMTGERDKAESTMLRLTMGEDAGAEDFLNLGHLRLAEGKLGEAAANYARYVKMNKGNSTALINAMRADTGALVKLGVKPAIIPLVIDASIYKSEE